MPGAVLDDNQQKSLFDAENEEAVTEADLTTEGRSTSAPRIRICTCVAIRRFWGSGVYVPDEV
jgi:hypothetical protein